MSEIAKTYSSKDVESKWYKKWEDGNYFAPRPGKTGKPYTVVVPLPNVTGKLHAGHALDITSQDSLIRFKRMKGFETLYIPGMDHAGIATQAVVEKAVQKETGKTRHDFTREEFLEKIWQWKKDYGEIILKQQRAMGTSSDWDYFLFSMDKESNEAVNHFFVMMYNEGLIYQSDYIVNWDPVLQSAISDAEVNHKDVNGAFYHIQYKVKDSDTILEIATTRPETLLGDSAVAVNPNDDRFKNLIGKTAIIPLCNREVPIVGDDHVDVEKGTGCLKVTPGHDFNDFEIGQRHNLEIINILNKDGTLNEHGMEFKGMSCIKARDGVIEKLKELNILVDVKDHVHPVGHGDRSKAVIEPMVSKQWFLNVKEMAHEAVQAVENGDTKLYPKSWENTYFAWLREPKNWCISRQLWWGHRIPIFYCNKCDATWASEQIDTECSKCKSKDIYQDPDVLDTWFSSGLWPFSTLGWPNEKRMAEKRFDYFFPNSTLITGHDIIFFWVARMMMMSLKAQKKVPFDKVYFHAIVRDKLGRKMSKSLNNGIDPLDIIDEYGADAFRFTLAAGSGYNRTLNLDPARIEGFRNFINKIWNAFRFIDPFLDLAEDKLPKSSTLDLHEKWILSELNSTAKIMNDSMEEFRYDEACSSIYSFVYDKFCSWFIELSKNILHGSDEKQKKQRATILKHSFKNIVALMHPFTPFITEELWDNLKTAEDDLLIVQDYPEYSESLLFDKEQGDMNRFIDVVTTVRNLRASVNIPHKDLIEVHLFSDDNKLLNYFQDRDCDFRDLAKTKLIVTSAKYKPRPKKSIMGATPHTEVFIPLDGVINIEEQIQRLEKELKKSEKELSKLTGKLSSDGFVKKAPPEVINEVKEKAEAFKEKISSIELSLKNFAN